MSSSTRIRLGFLLAILSGCLTVANAQSTSRAKPKPLATPPPVLTGAEIISRAIEEHDGPIVTRPDGRPAEQSVTDASTDVKELRDRIKALEATGKRNEADEKQKRLLMNLDILTRAEQRSESLRKQLFEMIEKENSVQSRLDQLSIEMRPEMIERTLQMAGSMRPEQVRENRRKSLEAEQRNLQALLAEIQSTRAKVTLSLQSSDQLVDKLRQKLEKDIDDALLTEPKDPADPI